MTEATFWNEQLETVVGRTVVTARMESDEFFDGMAPVLEFDDGARLMMLCDEEGNGPGRFTFL